MNEVEKLRRHNSSGLTKATQTQIDAALSQQADPKCSTCSDVGIVGHSDICPSCVDTWAPQGEPAPAQDEQQPVGFQFQDREGNWKQFMSQKHYEDTLADGTWPIRAIYAAPIAQTAPQGKFRMGDPVKKSTGSEWQGRVVGTYSTTLTPEGYAVESEAHAGSVQIYPAKALELLP